MTSDIFTRGVVEIIEEKSFREKMESGKKLRVKFGIDPTSADLHLGHTVPLRKLKVFQDLGHQVVLIIGDYTATIGDPSARKEARQVLSKETVRDNMKNYLSQVGKILDLDKTEVHYNTEWYDKKDAMFLFDLTSKVSIQRVLKRDDFQKRMSEDRDINMLETIYPLLQGYDSVCVEADIEIGGSDQKFNLLMGRRIQRAYGQSEQDIMTLHLLEGLDGVHKMSKSLGNYIGIDEDPSMIFGKIMSVPDDLILRYFELLTGYSDAEMIKVKEALDAGKNPRDLKFQLAKVIVNLYHGKEAAEEAAEEFEKIFSKRELPTNIPEIEIEHGNYNILTLINLFNAVSSNSDARRLVEQGAVKIDGAKITDQKAQIAIAKGMIVQVGKTKYYKIK